MLAARTVNARPAAWWLAALFAVGPVDTSARATDAAKVSHASTATYDVWGRRYHVLRDADGYRERGVASWYGHPFHGRRTASGEIYDMHAMTAAHKTLPIPTDVEVTNPRTGKKVIVRVNDRGPFERDRIIDLSYSAARALGLVRAGTGLVEIRALRVTRRRAATERPLYIQVGAFVEPANAERMRIRLEKAGFDGVVVREGRVQLGPVASLAARDRLIERLARIGIADTFLATGVTRPSRAP
jgi:rare lipoprotein A